MLKVTVKTAKRWSMVLWESGKRACSLGSPQGGTKQTQRRFPFQPPGMSSRKGIT